MVASLVRKRACRLPGGGALRLAISRLISAVLRGVGGDGRGWRDEVLRFAEGLEHPRTLYTLPNGDVLVSLTRAPQVENSGGGNDRKAPGAVVGCLIHLVASVTGLMATSAACSLRRAISASRIR